MKTTTLRDEDGNRVPVTRLISIAFKDLHHDSGFSGKWVLAEPNVNQVGWQVVIRGAAVFLVSPPGWTHRGLQAHQCQDGPSMVFELARADVRLAWAADEPFVAIDKLQRHDAPVCKSKAQADPEAA